LIAVELNKNKKEIFEAVVLSHHRAMEMAARQIQGSDKD
jgi:hypothetical protein